MEGNAFPGGDGVGRRDGTQHMISPTSWLGLAVPTQGQMRIGNVTGVCSTEPHHLLAQDGQRENV